MRTAPGVASLAIRPHEGVGLFVVNAASVQCFRDFCAYLNAFFGAVNYDGYGWGERTLYGAFD